MGTYCHGVLTVGPGGLDCFVEVVGNDLSGVGMEGTVLWGDRDEERLYVILAWRSFVLPFRVDPIHGLVPEDG